MSRGFCSDFIDSGIQCKHPMISKTVEKMRVDLSRYGINDVREVVYNPSYETLFAEETEEVGRADP